MHASIRFLLFINFRGGGGFCVIKMITSDKILIFFHFDKILDLNFLDNCKQRLLEKKNSIKKCLI